MAVILVVIFIVAAVAAVELSHGNQTSTTTSTQSTNTTTVSTSSTGAPSSSSSVTTTTGSSSSTSTTAANSTLTIDDFVFQGNNAGNVGPNLFYGSSDWPQWAEGSVYQTLVALNLTAEQQTNQLQFLPDLAANWTLSSDGMTYTFNLRHDVSFSNGDPFNAYDVWTQFYMEYFIYGNSSAFWEGSSIFNMSPVQFGLSTMSMLNQSGLSSPTPAALSLMTNQTWPVYATGPYTIVYHMNSPFNFFLGTLPGWLGMTFDPMYVLQHGGTGPAGAINAYFNTHAMPGTGPYVETKIDTPVYAEFQKNPNYWGDNLTAAQVAANPILDPGHYNTIVVQSKSSDISRYVDLTSGSAQISAVETSDFQLIENNPAYGFMTLKYPAGEERMAMNTQISPTNNTDVRLAIVHALNYTQIIDEAVFGFGIPMVGPETPNFGAYYDPGNVSQYSFNDTLAAQYLTQAGYPGGKGLPTLTMSIDSAAVSYEQPEAEVIQTDLLAVGIHTNIVITLDSEYYAYYGPYSYEVTNENNIPNLAFDGSIPYTPDFMTPVDYWSFFVTNYTLFGNYAIYNNPTVDSNVAYMFSSDNSTAIIQHLAVAEAQIAKDAPYAWLFDAQLPLGSGSYAYNKSVIGGFYVDPNLEGVCTVPLLNTIFPAAA